MWPGNGIIKLFLQWDLLLRLQRSDMYYKYSRGDA